MIRVEDLSKDYGPVRALDSVSFEVEQKQILGFLGPNGAGKSTAMKIITTYLAPTEGKVTVDGIDVSADPIAVRRKIGYLPETNPLYVDMRVDDYLRFCGEARGLSGAQLKSRFDYVVEAAQIGHVLKKEISELSKGFKQRTGLAQALIHDPPVLILDEPTSGLDPLQIVEIRKLIHDLAEEKTIIFSTHILSEISSTTDRVIIINAGRIIADGRVSELTQAQSAGRRLTAVFVADREAVAEGLGGIEGIQSVEIVPESAGQVSATLHVEGELASLQRRVGAMAASREWTVVELRSEAATLEDVFMTLVKRSREERSHA